MKGGRTAPRNLSRNHASQPPALASMKGGRTAPRNYEFADFAVHLGFASMKGGRTAPRNLEDQSSPAAEWGLQ